MSHKRLTVDEVRAIRNRAEASKGNWLVDFDSLANATRVIEDIPTLLTEVELLNKELIDREQSHIDIYCDNKELKETVKNLRHALEQLEISVIGHCDELSEPYEIATSNGDN
jgi:predicted metal-dependent hydrolase